MPRLTLVTAFCRIWKFAAFGVGKWVNERQEAGRAMEKDKTKEKEGTGLLRMQCA